MIKSFNKKEISFFEMFSENAKLSYEAAVKLRDFMNDLSEPESKYAEIKNIENRGDEQIHQIFEQLNKSFITPLDREDIHLIAKSMDEVTDMIECAASRFLMYNVDVVPEGAKLIAETVVSCTKEVIGLMEALKGSKKTEEISKWIISINDLEGIGDTAFRQNVTKLFKNGTPALEIVKWKDIYENLEAILDACEDVAHVIEGVVMKHA